MKCVLSKTKQMLTTAVVLLGMSTGAFATTLNFDTLPDLIVSPDPQIYQESGYQVTPTSSGDLGSFGSGAMHFDICCGPYTDSVTLTRTGGGLFSVSSLDLILYSGLGILPAYQRFVEFIGFRDGVGFVDGSAGSGDQGTINLKPGFMMIDALVIRGVSTKGMNFFDADYHFDIDNIVVADIAAVPLPAAAWSLLAALAALGAVGARRRRVG